MRLHIYTISLSLVKNSGHLTLVRHTSCRSSAIPIPIRVCNIFVCPNNGIWLPEFGIFSVCADVDSCDCTQDFTDTVRESALEVDSGRKIPCRTGDSNRLQYCALLFSWTLYNWAILAPGCVSLLFYGCDSDDDWLNQHQETSAALCER